MDASGLERIVYVPAAVHAVILVINPWTIHQKTRLPQATQSNLFCANLTWLFSGVLVIYSFTADRPNKCVTVRATSITSE